MATFIVQIGCSSGGVDDGENLKPTIGDRQDGAIKLNIDLVGSLQNPAFSPDGNSIVFTRRAGHAG